MFFQVLTILLICKNCMLCYVGNGVWGWHRSDSRRRFDPHRRRLWFSYSFYLPSTCRGGDCFWTHHHGWRRNRWELASLLFLILFWYCSLRENILISIINLLKRHAQLRCWYQGCHWDFKLPGKYNKKAGYQHLGVSFGSILLLFSFERSWGPHS